MNSVSIAHLTDAPWQQLQSLDISCNDRTAADIGQLSKQWPQLRELRACHVFRNQLRDELGHHVLPVTWVSAGCYAELDPAFTRHISAANWSCLETLDLTRNFLSEANLEVLGQCQWPSLKPLMLEGQPLTVFGCAMLSRGQWPLLESLDLEITGISSAGMAHIVSATWPKLKILMLSCNECNTAVYAQLAKGNWPQLERLCLLGCDISAAGMKQLVQGKWPLLKVLDVSCQPKGVIRGVLHELLKSDWLRLECLELGHKAFFLRHELDPENKAGLEMTDNLVDDPSFIAAGKWIRLQMLSFCRTRSLESWCHHWGRVNPRYIASYGGG